MKVAAVLIAGLGLAVAGTAVASPRISDLDYLRASRCKGIAEGLGADTAGVNALLKSATASRQPVIQDRAQAEVARAKREARSQKDKVSSELAGGCAAYMGGPEEFAATKAPSKAQ